MFPKVQQFGYPLPHPLRERFGAFLTEPADRNGAATVLERVSRGLTEAPAWDFGSDGRGFESLRARQIPTPFHERHSGPSSDPFPSGRARF
jgi:hypothetical protein